MRAQNASCVAICALLMSLSGTAFAKKAKKAAPAAAPSADSTAAAKPDDQKLDVSDLENKYWAPKDTDFSVVQNRTYTKEHRFSFSLEYGVPITDSYNDGRLYGFTGNYFLSERQGIQLTFIRSDYQENDAVKDLMNFSSGVAPDHCKLNYTWNIGYDFVPFYSKMSFMGKKILYFDMAVTPTIGFTDYEQVLKDQGSSATAFTYGIDFTQYYFWNNWLTFRVDWINQWYTQKVLKYQFTNIPSPQNEGDPAGNKFIHDGYLLFGATIFF